MKTIEKINQETPAKTRAEIATNSLINYLHRNNKIKLNTLKTQSIKVSQKSKNERISISFNNLQNRNIKIQFIDLQESTFSDSKFDPEYTVCLNKGALEYLESHRTGYVVFSFKHRSWQKSEYEFKIYDVETVIYTFRKLNIETRGMFNADIEHLDKMQKYIYTQRPA